jgi:hypothetical protein
MKLSTKLQMFIHHQYDNIKLVLQFVIILLVIGAIVNTNAVSERLSNENSDSRTAVLERIDRETQAQSKAIEEQTDKLNSQFQALCFIIVQIAGEEALAEIDPPIQEQCRDLTAALRQNAAEDAAAGMAAPVPQAPVSQPVDPRANQKTQPEPPRQDMNGSSAPPPPENSQSWIVNGIDGLLHTIGL